MRQAALVGGRVRIEGAGHAGITSTLVSEHFFG